MDEAFWRLIKHKYVTCLDDDKARPIGVYIKSELGLMAYIKLREARKRYLKLKP